MRAKRVAVDPLTVECPACHAPTYSKCVDGWGAKAPTHPERIMRADGWCRLQQVPMSFDDDLFTAQVQA